MAESLVLDGLALNNAAGDYVLRKLSMPPPKKRLEWVTGDDTDGGLLLRDPLFENREITATIRVAQQVTMDAALAKIATIGAKLEEAERQRDGLPLVWTPNGSTKSYTLYVLTGELEDVPVDRDGDGRGWFLRYPLFTVRATARPFGYGAEVTGPSVTSSLPAFTLEIPDVPGDVPAEARLVVTDMASKKRKHVEWGREWRYYDPASPPALLIDSDSLVTTGFAGTQQTFAGAYDPNADSSDVIRAFMGPQPVAVCGTGPLSHVGTYRVKLRADVSAVIARLRFAYRVGDGPLQRTPWLTPHSIRLSDYDFGVITIPPAVLGAQRWEGQVEATTTGGGDSVNVDYLVLIPVAEGYGKARGSFSHQTGATVARDEFTTTTAGNALGTRAAPQGGSWAGAGDADDFVFADSGDADGVLSEALKRATTSDTAPGRVAVVGTTNYTDTEVGCDVLVDVPAPASSGPEPHVVARYVDASNHLFARLRPKAPRFDLKIRIAGTDTTLENVSGTIGEIPATIVGGVWYRVILIAWASGHCVAELRTASGSVLGQVFGYDTRLATGGTLASGKPGIRDEYDGTSAVKRYYDNFYAATPAAEPFAIASGQSIEFRAAGDDAALREDAAGTYWGRPPFYRGSRFYLNEAGDEDRTNRILVKPNRFDLDVEPDDDGISLADSTKAEVFYTPRYLAVPH